MSTRQEVLSSIDTAPTLNASSAKLISLLNDSDAEFDEIARFMALDPLLTALVLKEANSAISGSKVPIGNVEEALMRVGASRVLGAVLAMTLTSVAVGEVKGYDLGRGALLQNCISVAMASEEIAKAVCKRPPQESFAAGLLANIGKMVLDKFVVREIAAIRDLAFDQGFSHDRAEAEVLGIDHAEAGAILLERWNLPEKIVEVVRFHHRPGLGSEENRQLIELVHMAEHATTLLSLGGGNDGTNYEFDQSCAARWGLTDSILETVLCRTMSRWEETQDFLPVLSGQEVNHEL